MTERATRRMHYPLTIPDELLNSPAMQQACANRDIQEIFRLVNRRTGASQADIAAAIGKMTSARIGDVIRGDRKIRGPQVIERIADGLGIPGHLLGLQERPWETHAPALLAPPVPAVETWELLDTLTRSEVSTEALVALEAAVFTNATLYPSSPPGQLLPQMVQQLSKIQLLLDRPQSLRTRRKVVQLLGTLAGLAGNAFIDVNDLSQSAALFHVGQIAAQEAEDAALMAWLLTMQSIGPYFSKRPEEAVALLTRAQALSAAAPARRRAWINANLARAHAAVGNRAQTLEALNRSAVDLTRAEDAGGIDFFNAARFDGIAGSSMLLIGDFNEADRQLSTAVHKRDTGDAKGRALLTFDLAQCRIGQNEVEEACRLAQTALDMAHDSMVQPIINRANGLRSQLAPWQTSTAVAALTERVAETSARPTT
jgi:tetratricopeptide (TPR) repeat protein